MNYFFLLLPSASGFSFASTELSLSREITFCSHWKQLAGDPPLLNLPITARQKSTVALSQQPELAMLRKCLQQQLFSGTWAGSTRLPASLPTDPQQLSVALERIGLDDQISALSGGCLVGVSLWLADNDPGRLQVGARCSLYKGMQKKSEQIKRMYIRCAHALSAGHTLVKIDLLFLIAHIVSQGEQMMAMLPTYRSISHLLKLHAQMSFCPPFTCALSL